MKGIFSYAALFIRFNFSNFHFNELLGIYLTTRGNFWYGPPSGLPTLLFPTMNLLKTIKIEPMFKSLDTNLT